MKKCKCKDKVKMSVPEGKQYNTPYTIPNPTMDTTLHSKHYYDYDRNKDYTPKNYMSFDEKLDVATKTVTDLLKEKNKAYGNSALNPAGIFSKLNATEALCARIDDKIMRIKNKGINDETEDTVDDLIGYLLLLKMSM
tara:strand:+ start:771 stop:1184 length:414 start_codon:yes stop_codon:yes gene_type:complete